ncbi:MAG: HAD family hydrolase [Sphaerochaetaceae bacterium]
MLNFTPFKGVLFDLDGTLIDTIGDITYAINSALVLTGADPITPQVCQQFVGRGLKNALRLALESSGKAVEEPQLNHLVELVIETYAVSPYDHSHPYPGIEALLTDLHKAGISLGVLSNKTDSLVQPIIRGLLGHHPFIFIRGAAKEYTSKPSPEGVYAFGEQLGCSVNQLLLVGDSEVDYYTAEAAKMRSAIVTWGFRTRETLLAAGCSSLYDTVGELRKGVFPWL